MAVVLLCCVEGPFRRGRAGGRVHKPSLSLPLPKPEASFLCVRKVVRLLRECVIGPEYRALCVCLEFVRS